MQSDVSAYWQDAVDWQKPFHLYHVPGYPLFIALLHGILGDLVAPDLLMQLIAFSSLILGAYFLYLILQELTQRQPLAELGSLGFALYPLVGITYVVYPLPDSLVMMLFLGGLWFLLRDRYLAGSIFLGLALITHKAIWPFVGLALLIRFFLPAKQYNIRNPGKSLWWVGILFLPIILIWLLGAEHHSSFWWIIESNLKTEISTRSTLPILDGILGTFSAGGIKNYLKSLIALLVFLCAGYLAYHSIKGKNTALLAFGFPVAVSVLVLAITINQYEIWAVVRFSRLLALPAILLVAAHNLVNWIPKNFQKRHVFWGLVFVFMLSNLLYAWYMSDVFFS